MEFFLDPNVQMKVMRAVIPALMAVLFAQSGLDKVFDFQGNLSWMTNHFSKTILKGIVRPSLLAITLMELAAAVLCAAGALVILISGSTVAAFWGLIIAAATLIALFAGQRIAKDYPGAATIAMYAGIAVLGIFVLR